MERVLARSEHYAVSHEFEVVFLDRPSGPRVVIGDFYGDPIAAVIDCRERWVAAVGCGIILYRLREPFTPYEYDKKTKQWWEALRGPEDVWWIKAVYQVEDDNAVRFVVDRGDKHAGVYQLDVDPLSISRVIPRDNGA